MARKQSAAGPSLQENPLKKEYEVTFVSGADSRNSKREGQERNALFMVEVEPPKRNDTVTRPQTFGIER